MKGWYGFVLSGVLSGVLCVGEMWYGVWSRAHAKAKQLHSKTAVQNRILHGRFQKMHSNFERHFLVPFYYFHYSAYYFSKVMKGFFKYKIW